MNQDKYIAGLRMHHQHISHHVFNQPVDVVKHMVAMQAQDYAGAKWAVGLRMQKNTESVIEQAITDGTILRTHLMRPTWHFVSREDIRWLIELTAGRIHAINAGMYKKFELDTAIFNKSNDVFVKAMQGGNQLTRAELTDALNGAGIPTDDLRFTLLLMHAELDAVICSGGRQGKQFTYALLDERAPNASGINRNEALARLAYGYFNSRGPATVRDLAYWSGLTVADAQSGLEQVKHQFSHKTIDGITYWMPDYEPEPTKSKAYLLPAYDEFAIAYQNRDHIVLPKYREQARYVVFDPVIVIDNQVAGNWKRTIKTNHVELSFNLFGKLNKGQTKAVDIAANNYKKFLELY
ncbi:MAG TPA: winged helix DNA-binding domain-containing protein [Mucilaginibacter sp.]